MGSVVTCLAYLEFPNSILIKYPKIDRIVLIFPDSPVSEMRSPADFAFSPSSKGPPSVLGTQSPLYQWNGLVLLKEKLPHLATREYEQGWEQWLAARRIACQIQGVSILSKRHRLIMAAQGNPNSHWPNVR